MQGHDILNDLPLKIKVSIESLREDYLSAKTYRLTPDISFKPILTRFHTF